ncbi:oxidoreductase [Colletotrichum kahawae]|uniref:Oxidoreductase n=1 Tax=Colletotrichum kahawae TaxID=34407 RepID=A0AAD9YHI6_COLKA|nr:oxidoreductase [Colletotrichum kahawae]
MQSNMKQPIPRGLTRTARHLSATPVELVLPIIDVLPLHRVLDLLAAERSIDDGGWALEAAIRTSAAWSALGDVDLGRLSNLWVAFNQLSLLITDRRVVSSRFQIPEMDYTCYDFKMKNTTWLEFMEKLEKDLETIFNSEILWDENFFGNGRNSRSVSLMAVCQFTPGHVDLSDYYPPDGVPKKRPEGPRMKTVAECVQLLPHLFSGHRRLKEARSSELRHLADLFEMYPDYLESSKSGYYGVKNPRHIPRELRGRARTWKKSKSYMMYRHPVLVPRSFCFDTFSTFFENIRLPTSDENEDDEESKDNRDSKNQRMETFQRKIATITETDLRKDFQTAAEGIDTIHTYEGIFPRIWSVVCEQDYIDFQREVMRDEWTVSMDSRKYGNFLPATPKEMAWLDSFLRCVKWIESQHVTWAEDFRKYPSRYYNRSRRGVDMDTYGKTAPPKTEMLLELSDFLDFIQNAPAEEVARQLQADRDLSKGTETTRLPSLTALHMPKWPSARALEVARCIWPWGERRQWERRFTGWQYDDMIKSIKDRLKKPHQEQAADGLKRKDVQRYRNQIPQRQLCYVCSRTLSQEQRHKTLGSMCVACGDFNLVERAYSMPGHLCLLGNTALVTGARINLGFHTALRLLRCGAFVIASSRYPEDAFSRYQKELDFEKWKNRLRIVGADFRAAKDAFALVEATKAILREEDRRLDILINNAAQTLTEPINKEQIAATREQELLEQSGAPDAENKVVVRRGYTARVRGGATLPGISGQDVNLLEASSQTDSAVKEMPMTNMQISSPPGPSSWVQSLSDIPYEDVITAHSVNTFVPLILIRELLPGMQDGHIVNVSSREGIFETHRASSAKRGHHVHTNMSKAGLNMITETEAATAWKKYKVAMNTVDPGYMSAAPEYEDARGGERPIGWEDGASRVLWPIARSVREQMDPQTRHVRKDYAPMWDRFLKHYGAVRADARVP